MAITAARFYRNPTNSTAKGLFRASLLYLPVFMVGLMVHRTPERWQHPAAVQKAAEDGVAGSEAQNSSGSRQLGRHPQPAFGMPFPAPFPLLPLPNRDAQR